MKKRFICCLHYIGISLNMYYLFKNKGIWIQYKWLLKLTLLLTMSVKGFGQTYYFLPNNNGLWKATYWEYADCNNTYPTAELQFESSGDTIINSLTYHMYIK